MLLSSADSAVLRSPPSRFRLVHRRYSTASNALAVRGDGAGAWPCEREKLGAKQGKDCVGVHNGEAASRGGSLERRRSLVSLEREIIFGDETHERPDSDSGCVWGPKGFVSS